MNRRDLINSKEYWIVQIQNGLYNVIDKYRKEKGLNKTQLAKELGVSKGYISQILNGDFDHKISKLVELALHCQKAPVIRFEDLDSYMNKAACHDKDAIVYEMHIHVNEPFHTNADSYAGSEEHVFSDRARMVLPESVSLS